MKRDISFLIRQPLGMLTDAERRVRQIALDLCVQRPCPYCQYGMSYFAACGITVNDYDFDVGERPRFACVKCHRVLSVIRPLTGPDWRFTPLLTLLDLRQLYQAAQQALDWFRSTEDQALGAIPAMQALERALAKWPAPEVATVEA